MTCFIWQGQSALSCSRKRDSFAGPRKLFVSLSQESRRGSGGVVSPEPCCQALSGCQTRAGLPTAPPRKFYKPPEAGVVRQACSPLPKEPSLCFSSSPSRRAPSGNQLCCLFCPRPLPQALFLACPRCAASSRSSFSLGPNQVPMQGSKAGSSFCCTQRSTAIEQPPWVQADCSGYSLATLCLRTRQHLLSPPAQGGVPPYPPAPPLPLGSACDLPWAVR